MNNKQLGIIVLVDKKNNESIIAIDLEEINQTAKCRLSLKKTLQLRDTLDRAIKELTE